MINAMTEWLTDMTAFLASLIAFIVVAGLALIVVMALGLAIVNISKSVAEGWQARRRD